MGQPSTALHELSQIEFLTRVWSTFWRDTPPPKRRSSGPDGISFLDFRNLKDRQISEIRQELLNKYKKRNGMDYVHHPLQVFPLEKEGKGEYRIICIPTIKDRLIQKAILQLLSNKGMCFDSHISFGCSSNRSVKKALSHAREFRTTSPWVYKTDIYKFFDNIPRKEAKEVVRKNIPYRSLHHLLDQVIDADITTELSPEIEGLIQKNGIVRGRGLRQGLPLSPLLSNLFLSEFDATLTKSGLVAIRYADDMAIFCSSKKECIEAHSLCDRELRKVGLRIPPLRRGSKTRIYRPEQDVDFLGLGIVKVGDGYELKITQKQIDKVWKKFERLGEVEKSAENEVRFLNVVHRLEALIHSYSGHYGEAANYQQFERKLRYWQRLVIRRILDSYGIEVDKLSFLQKRFMHLC